MIILLSPAKTFKETKNTTNTLPYFYHKSQKLIADLQTLSLEELEKYFNISRKTAFEVYHYYQNFNPVYQAFSLYDGAAFKKLAFNTLKIHPNNQLFILDSLYGVLSINDSISQYRLDFLQSYFKDLYTYWQDDISSYFQQFKNETIINLASNEFIKMLNNKVDYITIDFKLKDKRISNMLLKQMRGLFARVLLENNYSLESLKTISIEGFTFDHNLSTNKLLIFTK